MLALVNCGLTAAAHAHVSSFWRGKAHITFAKDFSDSIDLSNWMRRVIAAQVVGWAAVAAWVVGGWVVG